VGGNFGVVTSFTLALHPVAQILGGYLDFTSDDVARLLHQLRNLTALAPDELTLIAILTRSLKGQFVLSAQVCYAGEIAHGNKLLAAMRGSKLLTSDTVKRQLYIALESQVPMDILPVHHLYHSGFVSALTDAVIGELQKAVAAAPPFFELSFIHMHGAVTRRAISDTAFPLRTPGFIWGAITNLDPITSSYAPGWTEATAAKLERYGRGNYVNTMDREGDASVRSAYGENYMRLATLKSRYDPMNVFATNQNIKPAGVS
jgi:FAD/FMN-containing dehydrogenase